ncbi:TetR family transcriptional regulator [Planktothrix sp. FACHB-1355]|uniref:TetR family transcriptional regulator n=1 Tax=Aerosakkonema funiforme FACHB-1375 TaxID=2949571 RepID=A0A926ZES2_9CYAN|nr:MULTISPECIES: TetR family transcriptional regulator [Oscillatoriales]MBD2180383.1 TetR family transcriptional regulator [Aerosakkonema funiforme FACHB-1375]MBD3557902.1 TetR family transcriptional regulator [Planktothrix sp. FACHB-1355]
MTAQRKSARQRLVQAALQLFAAQGVTETTTRQIAELADVNEVTLFRNFGSKHGLLLAVIEEAEVFTQLGEALGQQANQIQGLAQGLQAYAEGYLGALEEIREFVRSLVGEAGHYPPENRQAIGRGLAQIHRYTVQYLTAVISREQVRSQMEVAKLASLLNTLLLGYAAIEFTTEFHELWSDKAAFIADLVELFLSTERFEATSAEQTSSLTTVDCNASVLTEEVLDLPAPLVRAILQKARKSGSQDYALVYVLFATGLSPGEIASLQRSHSIFDDRQHLLQVHQGAKRQVPVNQWIMGHRYGTYTKNPLTQWLKTRRDEQPALFINDNGRPISEVEVRLRWQQLVADIVTLSGYPPAIEQAQQTWCVEMLMRGMNLEGLSILTGCDPEQLQPYTRRAQEKAALEQAIRLDRPPASKI